MSSEIAIKAQGLGKSYLIYAKPQDRLKQMILRWRKYYQEYWAVQNVDLTIRRGEAVGIIGRNGSGKSTLLQMIAGTLQPNSGGLSVEGRVAPLLELGAGFNPEFTGRENVRLAAAILGLTASEIHERQDAIIDFAGIGDFVDQPVKTYSSGMFARLAFAVAAHVDADILIIDEIQTGAGRTGEWFAFQHTGVTPDAITVAKGIGGGFPIGALITYGEASELFYPGTHGSTFGGNALATAVSVAVLEEIERAGLLVNATERGGQLRAAILGLESTLVTEVRGRGLLIGIGLRHPVAGAVVAAAQQHGLIVNAANEETVRLAPALTIGDVEVDEFIDLFGRALRTVEDSLLLDESHTTPEEHA